MEICLALSTAAQWAALLFYSGCFLPQILTNYRIKSAKGMSDAFIWCYLTGYLLTILYVYGQPFAHPYRVMVPLETILMGIIVAQRFYYDGYRKSNVFFLATLASILCTILAAFFIPTYGQAIATTTGWLTLAVFTVNQIPQILKIYRDKSTYGFSFLFITLTATGQVCELIGGVITHIPLPTMIIAARGLFLYAIYVYFFRKYTTRPLSQIKK